MSAGGTAEDGHTDGGLDPGTRVELDRVAARLDAEVRAEQAEHEAMALSLHLRSRRLADTARDWMAHGDTVEVQTCGVSLTGRILRLGRDLLVLATGLHGEVDVVLGGIAVLRRVVVDPDGEPGGGGGAFTLMARLTAHEVSGAAIVLTLLDGQVISGRVRAAAVDHVLLWSEGTEVAVPLTRIGLCWPEPA